MKPKKSFLYFILLLMREITFALTSSSLLQYDITNTFDRWFSNLLKFNTWSATWSVGGNFKSINHEKLDFEYDLHNEVKPFESKFFFYNVVYSVSDQRFSHIDWNLQEDKISVPRQSSYRFKVEGELRTTKEKYYCQFDADLDFTEFELQWNNVSSGVSMDISYENITVENFNAYDVAMQLDDEMEDRQKEILTQELKPALLSMLLENIKRVRPRFNRVFESITGIFKHTQQDYPDMFKKGRKYYYLIPKTEFYCGCTLKAIVVKGLSNIQSLKLDYNFGYRSGNVHSFLMKNVQGSAMLDYGPVKQKPLKLNFKIDHLSMSINTGRNYVTFEAPQFHVNSTSGPLTHLQSAVLLQSIEWALVCSLMPMGGVSMDVKTRVPSKAKLVNSSSPWETRKKLCNKGIPFIDVLKKKPKKM